MDEPEDSPASTIEETLEALPARPGVYLMKDAAGKVIYVGKAQSLRARVRSYFRESGDNRPSIEFLRRRITAIETITTDSDKEAVLLENTLIKKHRPRYNIQLRDDKTYISLRLDVAHQWPRLHRFRRPAPGDKALFFGPFSSSRAVKETLRFIQKIFPLRSCSDSVLYNRSRPCVLHQIDRCCAPCVGLVTEEKYQEYVDQTVLFLKGRREEVVGLLHAKMAAYAEEMAYEKAAAIRDRIRAIDKTIEHEKVASHRRFDRDVLALVRDRGRMLFTVLQFREGNLVDSRHFEFRDHGLEDADIVESFITQFYAPAPDIPRDILAPVEPANGALLRQALLEQRGGPVRLHAPVRGEKKRLIEMAETNARLELERRLAGLLSREAVMQSLQQKLKLENPPRVIECFDISNLQGSFVVASMTALVDGEPDKSRYRRFKIASVEGQDDFASMREVVSRRYARVLKDGETLPDLIVIDGGKGQLASALEALRGLGLAGKVPICGLAKARPRPPRRTNSTQAQLTKEERVFMPGRKLPIRFDQSDPALFLLMRIRDEAHRFGLAYHRKLRNANSLRSGLEEVPGVGPKRRRQLLTAFGSLTKIREATAEQIAEVAGLPPALAAEVWRFLHTARAAEPAAEAPGEADDDESGHDEIDAGEVDGDD